MYVFCVCVCVFAGVFKMKETADGVNQASVELSHAAVSLSEDHRLRVGRGRVSSRSSLLCCTRFAYVCTSTCADGSEDCMSTANSTKPGYDNGFMLNL